MIAEPGNFLEVLDGMYDGVYLVDRERKISFWNRAAQSITGYKSEEVLGRRCRDEMLVHVDYGEIACAGELPLERSIKEERTCEVEAFFRHREGHRVPVTVRVAPLRNAAGEIIGAAEVFRDQTYLKIMFEKIGELERMALLDPLTRLPNRRHAEASLQMRLEELQRYGWPFGILFIDIDHFKAINDQHGHDVGDKVLRLVSMTLMNSLRPFDFLCRWGGEEFVAVVVNISEPQLLYIAERARRLVEQSSISLENGAMRVTVSIGAAMAVKGDALEGLIDRADGLMYRSKSNGRNRVSPMKPMNGRA